MPQTVMFIHGAWMTPLCWEKFIPFFEAKGYECSAPAWPYREHLVDELRAHPDPRLAHLGFLDIVNHYADIIRGLDTAPILIGHSFGGLVVQMLLDRGLGKMGVAIDSAPARGILPFRPTVLRSNLHVLFTPFFWRRILHMSLQDFQYAFVNTVPEPEQKIVYQRQVVPETGRIFFQASTALFNNANTVNFNNAQRPPLLMIAGESDHIVKTGMVRENAQKYKAAKADYKSFPGRCHWIIAQDGWEEVAGYAADWIIGKE